jgi:hypothetical protein
MYLQKDLQAPDLYCGKTTFAHVNLSKYHYNQYALINVTVIILVTKYRSF